MCYTPRKIEGGVGALRESDDSNFLKPNGQSRNLNIYAFFAHAISKTIHRTTFPNSHLYSVSTLYPAAAGCAFTHSLIKWQL